MLELLERLGRIKKIRMNRQVTRGIGNFLMFQRAGQQHKIGIGKKEQMEVMSPKDRI
jgi:hypothetical protein